MTFDYYYGPAQEMAADTETAAAGLVSQLQPLYPGTKGAGNCSGLTQPAWYFSHTFEPFTR